MNINDNASRLLSTVAIWVATAVIFVFGFFGGKIHVDGIAIYFWGAIGLALAVSPAIATKAIWQSKTAADQPKP